MEYLLPLTAPPAATAHEMSSSSLGHSEVYILFVVGTFDNRACAQRLVTLQRFKQVILLLDSMKSTMEKIFGTGSVTWRFVQVLSIINFVRDLSATSQSEPAPSVLTDDADDQTEVLHVRQAIICGNSLQAEHVQINNWLLRQYEPPSAESAQMEAPDEISRRWMASAHDVVEVCQRWILGV